MAVIDASGNRDPVESLAEEFVERHRRGERPRLHEYTDRYPQLAEEIRALFPAMLLMEELRPESEQASTSSGKRVAMAVAQEQLGDYRLLREVGRGGMGVVYEAEQESLGRHVAVKVLPTGLLTEPKHLLRFEREARAAARLHHTNIVPVFGVGQQDGLHYYVMQFIRGQGLDAVIAELRRLRDGAPPPDATGRTAELAVVAQSLCAGPGAGNDPVAGPIGLRTGPVQQRPMPGSPQQLSRHDTGPIEVRDRSGTWRIYPRSVAEVGVQVAQALEYAHAQGVLHRDIKPSNLLLDTQGNVWVTDFGLAKASDSADLTGTGDLVGTLRYMAPERFAGRSDARGDIYSLGLTLYELLAGRPAFDESNRNALIHQVTQSEPPALRSVSRGVPRDLETIIQKAMAREPHHRYPTAAAVAEDLRRFLEDRPIRARRVGHLEHFGRWCRRNPAVATLSTCLALALLMGFAAVTGFWREALVKRKQAEQDREWAQAEEKLKNAEAQRANSLAGRVQQQLVQTHAATGTQKWRDGDHWGALLYFAEAQRLDRDHPERQPTHQIRLTNLTPQAPRLKCFWRVPDGGGAAEFSRDGRFVVAASDLRWGTKRSQPAAAHVWDVQTGALACSPLKHGGPIRQATFSPDGRQVATASDDGTCVVWERRTGRPVAGPFKHTGSIVTYTAFSPDGNHLVSTGEDGTARVWDLRQGGAPLFAPLTHQGEVVHAEFSRDGRFLVTATKLGQVDVWDARSGVRAFSPLLNVGCRAWFSPNSRYLLTAFNTSAATLWEITADAGLRLLFRATNAHGARHAVFSPDSRRVAICYQTPGVQIWDVKAGKAVTPLFGLDAWIWHAAFTPSGRSLATVGDDRMVRFWDTTTGKPVGSPLVHPSSVLSVAFHPKHPWLLTSSDDGTVRVWDLSSRLQPERQFHAGAAVRDVSWSSDGRLATAAADRTARIWDPRTGKLLTPPLQHEHAVECVEFSPSGEQLATSDVSGQVRIWDSHTGQAVGAPLQHANKVRLLRFSDDGRRLLTTCDRDKKSSPEVRVWDLPTRRCFATHLPEGGEFVPALSPDGRRLALGARNAKTVTILDAMTGQALTQPLEHRAEISSVSFSRDGQRLLTACSDSTLTGLYAQVWDCETGRPIGPHLPHFDGVLTAAFSPDGQRIVTGGDDKLARVWDAETGRPVTPAVRHVNVVLEVAFSPDGKYILTRTDEVFVWEAATGHLIATLPALPDGEDLIRARFSPDGGSIATVSENGLAHLWRLEGDDRSAEDWLGLVQMHAGHRIDATGGLTPLSTAELEALWQSPKINPLRRP